MIILPIDHKALVWVPKSKHFLLYIDKIPHPLCDKIGGWKHPFAIKNYQTLKTAYVKHKCNGKWEVTCMGETWELFEV